MERMIQVVAQNGQWAPKEDGVGRISDAPQTVPFSRYYKRLIADGSLIMLPEVTEPVTEQSKKVGKK